MCNWFEVIWKQSLLEAKELPVFFHLVWYIRFPDNCHLFLYILLIPQNLHPSILYLFVIEWPFWYIHHQQYHVRLFSFISFHFSKLLLGIYASWKWLWIFLPWDISIVYVYILKASMFMVYKKPFISQQPLSANVSIQESFYCPCLNRDDWAFRTLSCRSECLGYSELGFFLANITNTWGGIF